MSRWADVLRPERETARALLDEHLAVEALRVGDLVERRVEGRDVDHAETHEDAAEVGDRLGGAHHRDLAAPHREHIAALLMAERERARRTAVARAREEYG